MREKIADVQSISSIGHQSERWRYKVTSALRPAATPSGLVGTRLALVRHRWSSGKTRRIWIGWRYHISLRRSPPQFSEVPEEFCKGPELKVVRASRIDFNEDILGLEGRYMVAGLRHLLRSVHAHRRRIFGSSR